MDRKTIARSLKYVVPGIVVLLIVRYAYNAMFASGASEAGRPAKIVKQSPAARTIPTRYSPDVSPVDHLYASGLFMSRLNLSSRYRVLNSANKLYVGDEVDRALEVFATPPRSYDVNELPPGWNKAGFVSAGWETSSEGFGAILQKGRVAVALFTVEHADDHLFERLITDYSDDIPVIANRISGKRAKYAFWSLDDQTLMVCGTSSTRSGNLVTVALGPRPLMAALRMSPEAAKEDIHDSETMSAPTAEPASP